MPSKFNVPDIIPLWEYSSEQNRQFPVGLELTFGTYILWEEKKKKVLWGKNKAG